MRVWFDQFSQIRSVFSSSLSVFNRFSQRTVLTMLGLRASPEVHRTDSGRSKCNPTSPIFQWGIKQNAKSPLLNGLQVDHTNWSEMFGDSLFFVVCSWGWVSLWFMKFERILTWNVDGFRGYDWVFCFTRIHKELMFFEIALLNIPRPGLRGLRSMRSGNSSCGSIDAITPFAGSGSSPPSFPTRPKDRAVSPGPRVH